jgi:hypothetical protein
VVSCRHYDSSLGVPVKPDRGSGASIVGESTSSGARMRVASARMILGVLLPALLLISCTSSKEEHYVKGSKPVTLNFPHGWSGDQGGHIGAVQP